MSAREEYRIEIPSGLVGGATWRGISTGVAFDLYSRTLPGGRRGVRSSDNIELRGGCNRPPPWARPITSWIAGSAEGICRPISSVLFHWRKEEGSPIGGLVRPTSPW